MAYTTTDITLVYHNLKSIKATARHFDIGESVIRKTLITAGAYTCAISQNIAALKAQGLTNAEIMQELKIGETWLNVNLPYTKGTYYGEPTPNALKIRRHRAKKKLKG